MAHIRSDKNFEKVNLDIFKEEMRDLGGDQPIIIAIGRDAFKVLSKPTTAKVAANLTNELSALSTNRSPRRRLNEAELVRMLREGLNPENETGTGAREIERAKGIVGDPVLARALD